MIEKTTIPIKGMHCRSCELLIEEELCRISGIKQVSVSQKRASAQIEYEGDLHYQAVTDAIGRAGYEIGVAEKKPLLTKNRKVYIDLLVFGLILYLGYMLLNVFGIKITTPAVANHPSSLFVVLLIGLTAGFSTCMALIGGLILGVSARFSEKHPLASSFEKFRPHIYFNLGRIGSYIIFGALIGMIGSFFQLSGFGLGLLTVVVSLVMLLMGLQLTGISPRLEEVKITLPSYVARKLGIHKQGNDEYSNKNAALMGALTFFLPCGFTQAMQLYAMTTGNPISGALIMGVFAIGTAPGLLGIGGLTSVVSGAFAQSFFRVAGAIVVLLSLFNLSNGLNLTGFNPVYLLGNTNVLAAADQAETENGVQIIRMNQDGGGYSPNSFTVKKDIPVRWIINSRDPNTCAASIVADKINVRTNLHPGENVIEFTPSQIGRIPFSCSMGMFTGVFNVVMNGNSTNALAQVQQEPIPTNPPASAGCKMGGCGCAGNKAAAAQKPVVTAIPVQVGNTQVLKTTYTNDKDISPNEFSVKVNVPVRLEITVQDQGGGCMGTIMVPRLYENPQFLAKGTTIIMEFTPTKKGDYPITCAMGVSRGVIKVT